MKCDRCGKDVDPVYPHTCTPLALKMGEINSTTSMSSTSDTAPQPQPKQEPGLDLLALIDENQRLRAELKFNAAPQPQPDEHVDCPRCGHCCPDDTELRQLREQNDMLDAEAAKDEVLLRLALLHLESYRDQDPRWEANADQTIAALRERLK